MLQVRFHGRGGQGIKIASRILGTAAFLAGRHAQDAPIYGAERRGAPLAASTRIDDHPICERGIIFTPDLIVVADETLLHDAATGVFVGQDSASALFVNSRRKGPELAERFAITCPVYTSDLTSITTEWLGRGSALSAPLGAMACALVGLEPLAIVEGAVRQELEELQLGRELTEKNVEVACRIYVTQPAMVRECLWYGRAGEGRGARDEGRGARDEGRGRTDLHPLPLTPHPSPPVPALMHTPVHFQGLDGLPIIAGPGNSRLRHTGSWREFRPNVDLSVCTRCGICFAVCPDGAITLDAEGAPHIDYDNCKGCMICSQECPIHGIQEQREVEAW